MPLAALVTKFGGGLPAWRLQAGGGTDNPVGGPYHMTDRVLPAKMMLAGNCAENARGGGVGAGMLWAGSGANNCVGGRYHQV